MPQGKRRSWLDADSTALMSLWDPVGSVQLIAIMLKRSRSSVQTQASRLNLPPRAEESDRHRRRWGDGDDAKLDGLIVELGDKDGTIDIQRLAERMGRSVDAVVARIESRHGEDSDVMARLVAPPMPAIQPRVVKKEGVTATGTPIELNNQAKPRNCLKCSGIFKSSGNHNWICQKCKRTDDWDYS